MIPVLVDFGIFKVYTFGIFLLLSFYWGLFIFWKGIRLTSYKERELFDCVFISLFFGALSARILYVILNFTDFGANILKFILINGYPGMSLWGFYIGAIISFIVTTKHKGMSSFELLDYIAAPFLLSVSIAKIGSFLSGVEVGTRTNFFLSVYYSGYSGLRHLTPFYESIIFLFSFLISFKMLYAIRRGTIPKGANFFFFIFSIGFSGFLLDSFYENRLYFGSFAVEKMLSFIFVISGAGYFLYNYRKELKELFLSLVFAANNYGKKTIKKTREIFSGKIGERT